MHLYILRRLLYTLPIIIGVTIVCFSFIHLAPGDPVSAVLPENASAQVVAEIKAAYGFDKPLPVQYLKWLSRVAEGDFGTSIMTHRPVVGEVLPAVANTALLAVVAILLGFSFGISLGLIAGFTDRRVTDRSVTAFAVTGISIPHYWLGMVLVVIFAVLWRALPATGIGPSGTRVLVFTWDDLRHLILPAVTLAMIPGGVLARSVRAMVTEVRRQEFVQTLRGKGLGRARIFLHIIKNAAPPILAIMGLQFAQLLGGSILVETVFAWPGTGFLLNAAIATRDLPLLQGTVIVLATFFVLTNLAVDILQTAIDPQGAPNMSAVVENLTITAAPRTGPKRRGTGGFWRRVARHVLRDKVALLCAIILALIALSAIFAPWIAPADAYKTSMVRRLLPPLSPHFILGTDELGRDMLSRLIYGGRVSLSMGLAPVIFATLLGGSLGVTAGYFGRHVNMAIMRVVDVFYAFPSVLLAVAMAGVLGSGIVNSLISLTLVFIPPIARVAESMTTQVRNQDYVEAARATGASAPRIILKHVLANVTGPILTYASSLVSIAIIISSGLSFLGLGAAPPIADWGLMLNTLRQAIYVAPVNAVLPGVMIFAASVSFNLLSDSLRTAMDVRA